VRTGDHARHPRVGLLAEAIHTSRHERSGRSHRGKRMLKGAWAGAGEAATADDLDHRDAVQ
jgi:hypothetical protein